MTYRSFLKYVELAEPITGWARGAGPLPPWELEPKEESPHE